MERLQFPHGFKWGTATASYQIEGAADEDGRSPSIWDVFSKTPGAVKNGDTGDVACDHYHRFKQDVQLLSSLGTKNYRFSISWGRILPSGRSGTPNEPGIRFYSNLVDELLAAGIEPVVTLMHWDIPACVDAATGGGWAGDGSVVDEFGAYADVVFARLGDRVKTWITINEPWCCAWLGYVNGHHAPGKSDAPGVDPYVAGHNLLRSHARAVRVYRERYAETQKGAIGITLNSEWGEPRDAESASDRDAARRFMDFNLGWFADPIYKGAYPACMRETVGVRLPVFTEEERRELMGSSDFFGLNHYSSVLISAPDASSSTGNTDLRSPSFQDDERVVRSTDASWERTDMGWPVVPWGLRKLLEYIGRVYAPEGGIVITENGLAAAEPNAAAAAADTTRIDYYARYIAAVQEAISVDGVDVRGYFLWSFLDNFGMFAVWAQSFLQLGSVVYFGCQIAHC
jgi:beta-glucosidase/6-phospho-beta-glucosidase/beta-galactosidase